MLLFCHSVFGCFGNFAHEYEHYSFEYLTNEYHVTCSTWKLIDFDLSCSIEESLMTPRVAGTEDYVASESEESGIFTEKSDVYSLGKVFIGLIDSIILNQIRG